MQPNSLKTLFQTRNGQVIQRLLADAITEIQLKVQRGTSQADAQAELVTFLNDVLSKATGGTVAVVAHGENIVVQDNGGGVNAKSPGVANVTNGILNYARLQP